MEACTNLVLLCQSRNMVGQFRKPYLHRPIKILHFLTPGKIQKRLNITSKYLAFLTINLQAESPIKQGIFLHVILFVLQLHVYTETYSELCQISKAELFVKIVYGFQLIFNRVLNMPRRDFENENCNAKWIYGNQCTYARKDSGKKY